MVCGVASGDLFERSFLLVWLNVQLPLVLMTTYLPWVDRNVPSSLVDCVTFDSWGFCTTDIS